jgi:hypothetical protein
VFYQSIEIPNKTEMNPERRQSPCWHAGHLINNEPGRPLSSFENWNERIEREGTTL